MSTIVKVQLSQFSNGERTFLIYDEERKYVHQIPADSKTIAFLKMQERPKAFFNAKIDKKNVALLDEAPWQTW